MTRELERAPSHSRFHSEALAFLPEDKISSDFRQNIELQFLAFLSVEDEF